MDDRLKVSRFWEENFSIIQQTKDVQCPTPEEVYSDFILQTGLTHIDLDNFKVITCSLGRGIRLNKKRRKNQKRFYNVAPKRKKLRPEEHDFDSNEPQEGESVTRHENELLDNYLEHQGSMQINAMTVSALREKQNAPSSRKQMFEILRCKGLYKKFPMSKFEKFISWLKSPSGGQLACTDEIASEVSRFLYFSFPTKLKWNRLLDAKALNNYLITTKDAGLGPDGLKSKIERITIALKFLGHKKPKIHTKCKRAIAEYSEWLKPLAKQKKVLRMQNSWRNELCGFNLTMEDIDTAVSEHTIARFIAIMKRAMSKKKLTQEEYRLIVDTLITITITQESAIRPGAFQFMTLQEIDNPVVYISPTDGTVYNIVFVLNHKTFATHGPLPVPFTETVWIQLHNYLKYVRPQAKPKSPYKQNVFLNASGRMLAKPGKSVTKVTKNHDKHITATKIRHAVATAGNEQLTDTERRAIAKGIGHSMEVHNKVYTDLTITNVCASIEAQRKLHKREKINTL